MSITSLQQPLDPLTPVTLQQYYLLRSSLIRLVIAEIITIPIMLFLIPGTAGVMVALVQFVMACSALLGLYQLHTGGLQRALFAGNTGVGAALTLLCVALGLRRSVPFLPIIMIPVAWAAILGSIPLAWLTIATYIVIIVSTTLEVLYLPWSGFVQSTAFPVTVSLVTMIAALIGIGRFLIQSGQALRMALLQGQTRQHELEQLRDTLETTVVARTESLQQALDEVQQREVQLSQTLADLKTSEATIRELSAPIIPVLSGVLVLPLIGALDNARAALLSEQVLRAVEQRRAHKIIFDVTGLPVLDSQVAQVLEHTAAAVQLIGASIAIVGIRPEVAQTMVSLQLNFGAITTHADLQEALTKDLRDTGWQQYNQGNMMQQILAQ